MHYGSFREFIPERDDVDSDAVDAMKDVDISFMLRGFFGFEINNWSASIEAMTDVADGNDGAIVRLLGGYRVPLEAWMIGLEAFTTWADEAIMFVGYRIEMPEQRSFKANLKIPPDSTAITFSYRGRALIGGGSGGRFGRDEGWDFWQGP